MPEWKYSVVGLDPYRTAKASGRDLRISPKHAREICRTIKGMKLDEAMDFLKKVIEKKRAVPFKRYKKKVPHRRGVQKWYSARYPVKAAKAILEVLENADANAAQKELDPERLEIFHASALRARKIKKYIPRAFGRASPSFEQMTHIEIALIER